MEEEAVGEGLRNSTLGRVEDAEREEMGAWDWTMERMREGSEPRVMTVAQPAPVASSAAISLVSIPPVPSEEPSVDVLTVEQVEIVNQRESRRDGTRDIPLT